MKSFFNADFFTNNRQRLKDSLGDFELIVMSGNGLMQRTGDTAYQFRQDSNFWYLTGLNEPDLTLIMTPGQDILLVTTRSAERTVFDGDVDIRALKQRSGIEEVMNQDSGWRLIIELQQQAKTIHTCLPLKAYEARNGFYTNPARAALIERLRSSKLRQKFIDIRPQLAALRVVKQPAELKAIQSAIDITTEAFSQVHKRGFSHFEYEYEVEAAFNSQF